ncbi:MULTISPECIES: hypothetical protein [Rhodococcus erythropolis group]|uniref:Uncharacterized protein n=1 Tax=Rhodococcus erythropolis TaxID=1833 RepID=A0A8I0ZX55_RHOER|nr:MULTISPECIES: hypothetical protein [Rhodococcus erythropolis group]MBH5144253.1 hypothetical protein [Rhodococcus erythropolis]MDJ0434709.1 hypothetical protein [Rhodococcus qingshengii]QEM25711.1 hypothetical protein D6M20_02395 [Rhodococcus qingshengii]
MSAGEVLESPITVNRPGPAVWLLGSTGGAGVSTLAQWLSFAGDSNRQWPCGNDVENESPYVVIVARETSEGLRAAHDLIMAHRDQRLASTLLGLVTVAGSPALDKSVRQYREIVAAAANAHWRIEWHRFLAAAALTALPRWYPLDGMPEQTKGTNAVPTDVIAAGVGIVTEIQRSLPDLRSGH